MNDTHKSPEFEELYDRAVSSYAPPEPRPGLEQRILAHLEAHAAPRSFLPPRPRFTRLWLLSGLITASVLLVVILFLGNRMKSPSNSREFGSLSTPVPSSPFPANRTSRQPALHHPRHPARSPAEPVSSGLTSQERILAEFVARRPSDVAAMARMLPASSQSPFEKPLPGAPVQPEALSIKPIEINPIDSSIQEPPAFKGEL